MDRAAFGIKAVPLLEIGSKQLIVEILESINAVCATARSFCLIRAVVNTPERDELKTRTTKKQ